MKAETFLKLTLCHSSLSFTYNRYENRHQLVCLVRQRLQLVSPLILPSSALIFSSLALEFPFILPFSLFMVPLRFKSSRVNGSTTDSPELAVAAEPSFIL